MPGNRQLTYTVVIDTSSARQQAAAMRAQFENELKQIKVGSIAAPRSVGDGGTGSLASGADVATRAFTGLNQALGVFGIAMGVQQLYQFTVGVGQLGTEVARAEVAFNQMSGGAEKAQANVRAIQQAAGGTVSSFDALKIGVQAAALSLAQTSEEFAQITRAGRAVAIVSPVINDVGSAISELGLAAANLSFRRLDQLGLSVSEVRDGMNRLRNETDGLDDSQLFLQASVEALESKYGDLLNSTEAQATGFERLGVAIAEARRAAAQGGIGQGIQGAAGFVADSFNELNVLFSGVKAEASVVEEALKSVTDAYVNQSNILKNTPLFGDALQKDRLQVVGQLQEIQQIFKLSTDALGEDPALIGYQQQIKEIVVDVTRWGYATDEQINTLRRLYDELVRQKEINAPGLQAQSAEEQAKAIAEQRAANIAEQQTSINEALNKAASKAMPDLGIENTINLLKQQKAAVDAAINELIASSITDPDEINLRIAALQQAVTQAFADMAESMPEVDPSVTAGSFDVINQSMQALNQGFVDFLPNMAGVRDELISLSEEIAFTGVVTEEQAASLDYYAGAAAALTNETSLLTAVTDELGITFLASNPVAAGLVDAMYQAQASYLAGALTAEQYAGVMAALSSQLLTLASDAGVATSAVLALNAAQGGASSLPGYKQGQAAGSAIGQRIQTRQASIDRERARADAERAAKRAAAEAERSAKRAGKALEDGAKKAAQELKSALGKVPGLFSRTQVTEQDMKFSKAGVYQDKADEYLRRLQAEVEQGKDLFADVSIEDARQSLTALGVRVAEDNQVAFEQFVEAYESGLLFADPANVDKYINKEAVQRELELQKKAQEGKDNVYKAFGVAIDEAASAAVAGISSGGGSVAAGGAAALSGQLIPMTADGVPTLGGYTIAPTLDATALQEQLSALQFDITLGAETGSNLVLALGQQIGENSTAFMVQGQAIGAIMSAGAVMGYTSVGTNLVTATGEQIGQNVAAFSVQGQAIGSILAAGAVTGAESGTDIGAGLLSAIATDIAAQSQFFLAQGQTVGAIVKGGVASAFSAAGGADSNGQAQTDIAMGLVGALNSQFSASQNFFYAAGQTPAFSTLDGFKATFGQTGEGAPLVTPMVTALNTQIRMKGQDFQNQGITIAQYVQNGLSVGFNSEAFKTTLISVGESLYASIRTGLIRAADGGDLVESLGAKILADISGTVEAAE